jgi:predicted nuclease with TOPRIM domain
MAEVVLEAVSGAEKRRQALLEVRRRDSDAKRAHVRDTVEKMLLASERITFAAVARRAKVSSWLVYAEGVREQIQTAIRQQAEEPPETRDRSSAGVASLRTDLALAREEIKRLRSDNDRLRRTAQRLLGQQFDQVNVAELIARIDTLVNENRRLAHELHQTTKENTGLQSRLTELEEDVTAARTALRRMIREQTTDISGERRDCGSNGVSGLTR